MRRRNPAHRRVTLPRSLPTGAGAGRSGWALTGLTGILLPCIALAGCSPNSAGSAGATASANSSAAAARSAAGIPECATGESDSSAGQPSAGPSSTAGTVGRAVVGRKLPGVVLRCIGGDRPVAVSAQLAGRPHVINLWASWCRPCRAEAPMLRQVSEETEGRVSFLGIDYGEQTAADGISFARAAGWRYPQLEDPEAATRTAWGVPGLPVTLLVAADGTVVKRLDGAWSSAGQLREAIRTDLETS